MPVPNWHGALGRVSVPVSPASPENAISVCELRLRVLSSEAFRMVAPRIAALEAAIMVKSLPVIPSSTSLEERSATGLTMNLAGALT
jgi:hypothetical protein